MKEKNKIVGNGETQETDNPVPSLSQIKKAILKSFQEKLEDVFTPKAIENMINYSFEKFEQNGVETEKS